MHTLQSESMWHIRRAVPEGNHMQQNKTAELNAGIKHTIEQLANETDAATQSELLSIREVDLSPVPGVSRALLAARR